MTELTEAVKDKSMGKQQELRMTTDGLGGKCCYPDQDTCMECRWDGTEKAKRKAGMAEKHAESNMLKATCWKQEAIMAVCRICCRLNQQIEWPFNSMTAKGELGGIQWSFVFTRQFTHTMVRTSCLAPSHTLDASSHTLEAQHAQNLNPQASKQLRR